jgi:hypothetical protein
MGLVNGGVDMGQLCGGVVSVRGSDDFESLKFEPFVF